jgi:large subunit ribosomal protein L30
MGALNVTQRRSRNGANKKQLDTLRSLGLRRIGHTVQVQDSGQTRGMLHAVRHLIEVREDGKAARNPAAKVAPKTSSSSIGTAKRKPSGDDDER